MPRSPILATAELCRRRFAGFDIAVPNPCGGQTPVRHRLRGDPHGGRHGERPDSPREIPRQFPWAMNSWSKEEAVVRFTS